MRVYTLPVTDDEGDITGTPGAIIAPERQLEYRECALLDLVIGEVALISRFSSASRIITLAGRRYQKLNVHYKDAPFGFWVWERIE
jgi:hypothetical protein